MAVAEARPANSKRKLRERRTGVVLSNKGDKTIRVRFEYITKHRKYGKYLKRSTNLHAHDEKNEAQPGDLVEVMACRPISKTKTWRLMQIVRSAATR